MQKFITKDFFEKNLNVLIAEDDLQMRDRLNFYIKDRFKNIFEAQDGLEAYQRYCKKDIDIILTDNIMPKLTGLELAKKIREKDSFTQIIVITVNKDKASIIEAMPLNLAGYLLKPFDFTKEKIDESLNEAIDRIYDNYLEKYKLDEDLIYDKFNKKLIFVNEEIILTKKEYLLFELLIENKNNYVNFDNIALEVYPDDIMTDQAIKNNLLRLRKKLKKDLIRTRRNFGLALIVK